MANGGFKAFEVEFSGLGSDAALTDKMAKCKEVLGRLGDGLVSLGQGWSYDADRTSSAGNAILYGEEGSPQSYALYFRHSSGAKLMMSYNVYGVGLSYDAYLNAYGYTSAYGYRPTGGLSMSMIPANGGEYDATSTNPIPSDGLLLSGETYSTSNGSSVNTAESFLDGGDTSAVYKHIVAVRGTQIIWISKNKAEDKAYFHALGDIVECAHATDAHGFSAFAVVSPVALNTGMLASTTTAFNKSGNYMHTESFFSCDGTRFSGYASKAVATASAVTSVVGTGANELRWFPVMLYVNGPTSADMCVDGVNDGLKGFINHEVMCVTKVGAVPPGQRLDGGNFLMTFGGLIIGWDPSNTDVSLY